MEQQRDPYLKEYRGVSIRTVDGSTLIGKVNIGIKERVSDLFTKTDTPFIVLADAGHSFAQDKVLIVNKRHIVWVEPDE